MRHIHECEYCSFTSSSIKKCKEHEPLCRNNPKNYKIEIKQCDDDCSYAKLNMCNYNEHCDGSYIVKISTITGEIIY